jgi:hypothetical protein
MTLWGIRLVGLVAGLAVFVAVLSFRAYRLPHTVSADTAPVRRRAPNIW